MAVMKIAFSFSLPSKRVMNALLIFTYSHFYEKETFLEGFMKRLLSFDTYTYDGLSRGQRRSPLSALPMNRWFVEF